MEDVMKIAICDDEKIARFEIAALINKYRLHKNLDIFPDIFDSGQKLLSSKLDYDIIIMDYQMEDIDGIETSRRIRSVNKDCTIIFISAYPLAALDSFEVNTFRFITKPIDSTKLYKALDDYLISVDYDNLLILKTHEGTWKIKISDIIYAEANGKHTLIRTVDNTFDAHIHLKIIESKLPKSKFIRSHRAYVVGFNHIINHSNEEILFDNDEKAEIGKRYSTQFKTALKNYVIRYNKGLEK